MGSLDAKALACIEPHLDAAAQATVDDLVGRQSFDGVADFASRLPLSVVSELVGVSVDRTRLLAWGRRSFDGNGPLTNRRVFGAIPTAMTLWLYTALLNQARSRCPGTYWKSLTISPTCPDTSSGCAGGAASPAPDPQALHLRGFAGRTLVELIRRGSMPKSNVCGCCSGSASDYETSVIARPARGPRPACGGAPGTSRVAKFEMMHGEAL